MQQVEVTQIRPLIAGNLKAFASVKIGNLVIHSCRIVQQPNQRAWVSLPQQSWTGKDGKTHYSPVVEVPEHVKEAIQAAVLAAWGENGRNE